MLTQGAWEEDVQRERRSPNNDGQARPYYGEWGNINRQEGGKLFSMRVCGREARV